MALALDRRKQYSDDDIIELTRLYPALRFERSAAGELIVAPPTGMSTGRRNSSLLVQLGEWNRRRGLGELYDSSTGFHLPDGSLLSPDVSWVERSRVEGIPEEEREKFALLCPDVVFELSSPSDKPAALRKKMRAYVRNGAKLAVLILVAERIVERHRPTGCIVSPNPTRLEFDPELPGCVLDFDEILE